MRKSVAAAVALASTLVVCAPARSAEEGPEPSAEFAAVVLRLAAEADGIDRLWAAFKVGCGVRAAVPRGYGREWFVLWDRGALPITGSSPCVEMLSRVLEQGEAVRRDLIEVRGRARRALIPRATELGMLRWNGLEWAQ